MNKSSIKKRKHASRIRMLLSAVLAAVILLAALPVGFPASAAQSVAYKLEITTESKASGWNKATLKISYKSGGSSDNLDIKDELSEGKKVEWTFVRTDAVPHYLQMYLDFGGGFTIRNHSGRIKLYADDVELVNEPYSAWSSPFNSSDTTLDFGVWGVAQTELITPDGKSAVYPTVKHAWNNAKGQNGCTVKLTEDSSVTGTLEASNNVTFDFNGHLMSNSENTPLFRVIPNGNLKLRDSDPNRDTGEDFLCTTGMNEKDNDIKERTYRLKGGGIYHGGSDKSGGAVRVDFGGRLSVEGCTFTDCHSAESGGAIYCEGRVSLKGTKFIFCTALKGTGGAVCITHQPYAGFENLTFERCHANNGGAVSMVNEVFNGSVDKFDNCTFSRCRAEEYGGAVYHIGREHINANGLEFTNCSAKYGGGMYLTSSYKEYLYTAFDFAITGGKFVNCSARDSGGAIGYRDAANLTLKNIEFNGCTSEKNGGALYLLPKRNLDRSNNFDQDIRMENCDVHHCTAKEEGGAVYVYSDRGSYNANKTILSKSKVHDNAAGTGGGVYVESRFVYLVDSTLTNNKATGKFGGGVYVDSLRDIDIAGSTVIRGNLANNAANNLCLQNGTFSSAKMYSGGLEEGAYIGISTTSDSAATVGKNISQYQAGKYIHADEYARAFSMTNTREVSTPLFASMISENFSLMIIIGGVIIILCIILILLYRKRKREGRADEAKDGSTAAINVKEYE